VRELVALKFLPSDNLLDIIHEGFPFMAWLRSEPEGSNWEAFARDFESWAHAQPLKNLARDIRLIRKEPRGVGTNLTLLWDDPDDVEHRFQLLDVGVDGG
jgi:hypothetical protein